MGNAQGHRLCDSTHSFAGGKPYHLGGGRSANLSLVRCVFMLASGEAVVLMSLPPIGPTLAPSTHVWPKRRGHRENPLAGLHAPIFGRGGDTIVCDLVFSFEWQRCGPTFTTCRHTRDRKSTRLNSSHLGNSYAGFSFKKDMMAAGGRWKGEIEMLGAGSNFCYTNF